MASLNNNEVSYVGRTNDPWRRKMNTLETKGNKHVVFHV